MQGTQYATKRSILCRGAFCGPTVHLSTEEPVASRMLEPFGEVGGDVSEYFSSRTHFAKIEDKKVIAKN